MSNGMWVGRIANYLVGQMTEAERLEIVRKAHPTATMSLPLLHNYKKGQFVIFRPKTVDDYEIWVPYVRECAA